MRLRAVATAVAQQLSIKATEFVIARPPGDQMQGVHKMPLRELCHCRIRVGGAG